MKRRSLGGGVSNWSCKGNYKPDSVSRHLWRTTIIYLRFILLWSFSPHRGCTQ